MLTKPSDYMIGIILFVFGILGTSTMIGILYAKNPTAINSDLYSQYNMSSASYESLNASIVSLQESTNVDVNDLSIFSIFDKLIGGVWSGLRFLFTSLGFMTDQYGNLAKIFGIPAWIPTLASFFAIIIISFAIMGALARKDL
jgi:hypothetical protein